MAEGAAEGRLPASERKAGKTTVAVAGASGFVGSQLLPRLVGEFSVVGLTRRAQPRSDGVEWRACDLFSARSTEAALRGVDVAVYLVHSMMPSSRLFQGDFHDTDLLLADNFAKACAKQGVKQIVYLGGLVPSTGFVSKHLESRQEVEGVLQASGIPVTCLRAGMVVGPGGSSFEILRALIIRLPWMILPTWTQSLGQAVFIDDILAVVHAAVLHPEFIGKTFDVVNGETLTYETMLRQAAHAMGLQRWMRAVPIASTSFSKRWVQLFSGASFELVSPLIDSLQCDLPQVSPSPTIASLIRYPTFARMLTETLRRSPGPLFARVAPARQPKTVRSIQRLPPMRDADSKFISREYMAWLPRFFRAVIRVEWLSDERRVCFLLAFVPWPMLILEHIDQGSGRDRDKLNIVGGLLSKTATTGWLEFRQIANRRYTLAAIHEFVPALPWLLYIFTQAPIHAWVMRHFGSHLARVVQNLEPALASQAVLKERKHVALDAEKR